jgi:hypothetical protein
MLSWFTHTPGVARLALSGMFGDGVDGLNKYFGLLSYLVMNVLIASWIVRAAFVYLQRAVILRSTGRPNRFTSIR